MNFLNSPPGPLGAAGQTSTSTTPQNIFNNARGPFTRMGAGIQGFADRFGGERDPQAILKQLFSGLFGGDGGLGGMIKGLGSLPGAVGGIPGNLGQGFGQAIGNAASIFGGGSRPQNNATPGVPNAAGSAPMGGGILSRFMQGFNNPRGV